MKSLKDLKDYNFILRYKVDKRRIAKDIFYKNSLISCKSDHGGFFYEGFNSFRNLTEPKVLLIPRSVMFNWREDFKFLPD